jgi:hypothetical protein
VCTSWRSHGYEIRDSVLKGIERTGLELLRQNIYRLVMGTNLNGIRDTTNMRLWATVFDVPLPEALRRSLASSMKRLVVGLGRSWSTTWTNAS